jgi:Domain of unknown function (DUF397)
VSSIEQRALSWRRSSACTNGDCLEVAYFQDQVFIRNSRSPDVVIEASRPEWEAFVQDVPAIEALMPPTIGPGRHGA